MASPPVVDEPGIRSTPTGFIAYVRVGHLPLKFKRFAPDTPIRAIRRWRDETRVALRKLVPHRSGTTLSTDITKFLAGISAPLLHDTRALHLRWWLEKLGNVPRERLTSADIRAALSELRLTMAPSTCNHYRTSIILLLDAHKPEGVPWENPARAVPVFSSGKPIPRAVDYTVVAQILNALSDRGEAKKGQGNRVLGSKAKARLRIIAYSGMRHSELKRYVAGDWNRLAKKLLIRTGKDGNERTIPVIDELEAALIEFDRLEAYGAFSNSTVHRAFRAALKSLGLVGIRPYDLRHSFGTLLYAVTGDLNIVAEGMGHTTTKVTRRYTSGFVPAYLWLAMDRFAQAVRSGEAAAPPATTEIATRLRLITRE